MRKLVSGGLVMFAGMVSLPVDAPPLQPEQSPVADYRNDPRLDRLRAFFEKAACPAKEYSHVFLEAADDYELDWRLLPSISYVESTGGKAARNNNLFGWKSGAASFPSPSASIHTVGYHLAYSGLYRDKDLDQVLATYNPNIEYARKVKSVMQRIAPTE